MERDTRQRRAIRRVIEEAGRPLSPQEVLKVAQAHTPRLGIATVYRTLNSAAQLGFVSETDMGAGDTQFEWVGKDRHHHLICRSCEGVNSLDNSYLDSLATALHDDLGFRADLGHFAIFGICRECQG